MKSICITLLLFVISYIAYSQTTDRIGLNAGINIIGYIADNKVAEIYNGTSEKDGNINEIFASTTVYDQISEYYNYDFSLFEYPTMKYIPTIEFGGTIQYYIKKDKAIFSNLNFAKLQSKGTFLIKLDAPSNNGLGNNTQSGLIQGKENRFDFSIGLHKIINTKNKSPFFEIAPIASFITIEQHNLTLGNYTSSFYYTSTESNSLASFWGYGILANGGLQFLVKNYVLYSFLGIDILKYSKIESSISFQKKLGISLLF